MDVDLRKLRYFVVVAETLHFGRAAEELHITQPVLSRQIRALEDELAVQLFRRDRRSTALTQAGSRLLPDAHSLLAAAAAMQRRVLRAAHGDKTFKIGFMPGITVTAVSRELVARHPALSIDVLRTSREDQCEVLRDGRVDISFVRLPVDGNGLTLRPLFTEPRVAVLSAQHRLASMETLKVADLEGERLLQPPEAVGELGRLATVADQSERRPVPRTVEEKLELVATGAGMLLLPESTATFYTRVDLKIVPVENISPSEVCLAWSPVNAEALIDEFVELAVAAYGAPDAREASQGTE